MIAPISANAVIDLRWPKWKGVSRTIRISFLLSLRHTSAVRIKRLDVMPAAMEDIVCIEQGAITIPAVWNEPLASAEEISSTGYEWVASAFKSPRSLPVSKYNVLSAERVAIKWISAFFCKRSNNRMA